MSMRSSEKHQLLPVPRTFDRPLGVTLVTGGRGWVGRRLTTCLTDRRREFGISTLFCADVVPLAADEADGDDGACFVQHLLWDVTQNTIINLTATTPRPGETREKPATRTTATSAPCSSSSTSAAALLSQCSTVFHLAAIIDLRTEAPLFAERTLRVNRDATLNLYRMFSNASSCPPPAADQHVNCGGGGSCAHPQPRPRHRPRLVYVSSHDAAYEPESPWRLVFGPRRMAPGKWRDAVARPPDDLQIKATACPYARSKALTELELGKLHHQRRGCGGMERSTCEVTRPASRAASLSHPDAPPEEAKNSELELVTIRPTHVCEFDLSDPVSDSLKAVPFRMRCASGSARMSFVTVDTLVDAMTRASRCGLPCHAAARSIVDGETYYVKDGDMNFFQFYFPPLEGAGFFSMQPDFEVHIPTFVLIALAWLADLFWMVAYAVFKAERHPFLGLRMSGIVLPLADMTSNDDLARNHLGYETSRKFAELKKRVDRSFENL